MSKPSEMSEPSEVREPSEVSEPPETSVSTAYENSELQSKSFS